MRVLIFTCLLFVTSMAQTAGSFLAGSLDDEPQADEAYRRMLQQVNLNTPRITGLHCRNVAGVYEHETTLDYKLVTITMYTNCTGVFHRGCLDIPFVSVGTVFVGTDESICGQLATSIHCYANWVPNGAIVWGNGHVWWPQGQTRSDYIGRITIGPPGKQSCPSSELLWTPDRLDYGHQFCRAAARGWGMNFNETILETDDDIVSVCYYTDDFSQGVGGVIPTLRMWPDYAQYDDIRGPGTLRFVCRTPHAYYMPSRAPSIAQLDAGAPLDLCAPSPAPTTPIPTAEPSLEPTRPTLAPTIQPTLRPTVNPTLQPSLNPTCDPSIHPTAVPSLQPSFIPTSQPSIHPTTSPSSAPVSPSLSPTLEPTNNPVPPSLNPTDGPQTPSRDPTIEPSASPSLNPTDAPQTPSIDPTIEPSACPSLNPTDAPQIPSRDPTIEPSEGGDTTEGSDTTNSAYSTEEGKDTTEIPDETTDAGMRYLSIKFSNVYSELCSEDKIDGFLLACTASLGNDKVSCVACSPGSTIVTILGEESGVHEVADSIAEAGKLEVQNYATLSLTAFVNTPAHVTQSLIEQHGSISELEFTQFGNITKGKGDEPTDDDFPTWASLLLGFFAIGVLAAVAVVSNKKENGKYEIDSEGQSIEATSI